MMRTTRTRRRQRGGFALNPAGLVAADAAGSFRFPVLPWTVAAADERRFKGILLFCVAAALMGALALRVVTLPAVDRSAAPVLPPPMARLIVERSATPPPPPPPPALPPKAEAAAAPKPAQPAQPAQQQPQPARRVAVAPPAARQPAEGAAPGAQALEQARRKAASSGLLALRNEINALTAAPAAAQLQPLQPQPDAARSAPGAGPGTEAGETARAMVTAAAGRNSGGIGNLGASRDGGSGGLAGRASTPLAGGGAAPGAVSPNATAGSKPAAATTARAASRATRSIEDIKLVFERQKGAIYALYNRALRDDPSLQGKVVLELKVAPAGNVESVRIVSSELKSEELERKLLARIRSFDFGAKDVDTLVLTWPVDFLPG